MTLEGLIMKSHLLGLLCGCFILASTANADFTTYIYEQEGNTVVAGFGTIDLTGLIMIDDSVFSSRVSPGQGVISGRTPGIGAYSINGADFYTGIVEVGGAFSGGAVSITNEIYNDSFGVFLFDVIVPQGYVSGEYFSASMVYRNQTLSNLGMSEFIGSYIWKLPQDTFTLVIGEAPPILPVQVIIDIKPDGTEQECSEQGETSVQLTAEVNEGFIASVTWMIDGVFAGDTETISPFLALGPHSVQVDVVADNGATGSATEAITVADTTSPQIDAAFVDAKTGQEITQTSPPNRVGPSIDVTDACDPEPVIDAVVGMPSKHGDILFINQAPNSTSVRSDTNVGHIELSVSATDASGNTATENIQLELVK